jgi:hypothetical protein
MPREDADHCRQVQYNSRPVTCNLPFHRWRQGFRSIASRSAALTAALLRGTVQVVV